MRLELRAAVAVTAGIVQSDPALPQVGRIGWRESDEVVELGDRLRYTAGGKVRDGKVERRLSGWCSGLRIVDERWNRSSQHHNEPKRPGKATHGGIMSHPLSNSCQRC